MFVQQCQCHVQITILLLAFFDSAFPKRVSLGVGFSNGFDHRQCQLTFAKIVTDVFACRRRLSLIIEQVVDNLEGDAQRITIFKQRFYHVIISIGYNTANFCCGRK